MDTHQNEPIYSEGGIDLTLLRHNLRLTPTERWKQHERALELVEALREAGRVRRERTV